MGSAPAPCLSSLGACCACCPRTKCQEPGGCWGSSELLPSREAIRTDVPAAAQSTRSD